MKVRNGLVNSVACTVNSYFILASPSLSRSACKSAALAPLCSSVAVKASARCWVSACKLVVGRSSWADVGQLAIGAVGTEGGGAAVCKLVVTRSSWAEVGQLAVGAVGTEGGGAAVCKLGVAASS